MSSRRFFPTRLCRQACKSTFAACCSLALEMTARPRWRRRQGGSALIARATADTMASAVKIDNCCESELLHPGGDGYSSDISQQHEEDAWMNDARGVCSSGVGWKDQRSKAETSVMIVDSSPARGYMDGLRWPQLSCSLRGISHGRWA
ncbi:hypothetical protein P171DRAFT_449871 [Karstenula rhodostoma CBS 690.94]|uniref:Uncharacterized protein n=1 Tax=Karstenula rhodostoma CBS 690.94 TaxID=1392251 RepID=A0A9P4P6K8_9PLEO|nr:hypothetical protein P171DRAFT_449871 [Karstenula rhodostoma CBS 690.94]